MGQMTLLPADPGYGTQIPDADLLKNSGEFCASDLWASWTKNSSAQNLSLKRRSSLPPWMVGGFPSSTPPCHLAWRVQFNFHLLQTLPFLLPVLGSFGPSELLFSAVCAWWAFSLLTTLSTSLVESGSVIWRWLSDWNNFQSTAFHSDIAIQLFCKPSSESQEGFMS